MLSARRISCLLCGFLVMGASSAMAVPITFYFSGVVNQINDPKGELNGLVTIFSQSKELGTFSGQYTFDSEAPNTSPYPDEGIYWSQLGLTLTVGKMPIEANPFSILVWNYEVGASGRDLYHIGADSSAITTLDGFRISDFGPISFRYEDRNALSSIALPIEPPPTDLPLYQPLSFNIYAVGPNGGSISIHGNVLHIIPEPSALGLLVAGALVIKRRIQPVS